MDFERFTRLITAMDGVYLSVMAQRAKKDT